MFQRWSANISLSPTSLSSFQKGQNSWETSEVGSIIEKWKIPVCVNSLSSGFSGLMAKASIFPLFYTSVLSSALLLHTPPKTIQGQVNIYIIIIRFFSLTTPKLTLQMPQCNLCMMQNLFLNLKLRSPQFLTLKHPHSFWNPGKESKHHSNPAA